MWQRTEKVLWLLSILLVLAAWIAGANRAGQSLQAQILSIDPSITDLELLAENIYRGKSPLGEVYIALESHSGYGGPVKSAVVVGADKRVRQVAVLESMETSSYLSNVIKSGILERFPGATLESPPQVDAVTGATLTSEAIVLGLDRAIKRVNQVLFDVQFTEEPQEISSIEIAKAIATVGLFVLALWISSSWFPWSKKWGVRFSLLCGFLVLGVMYASQPSIATVVLLLSGTWSSGLASYATILCLLLGVCVVLVTRKNLYCQMICPFGAVQEGLGIILHPKPVTRSEGLRWLTRLTVLVVISLGLYYRKPGLVSFEPFSMVFSFIGSGLIYATAVLAILASLFIFRPWCNTLCPVKAVFDFIRFGRAWFLPLQRKERTNEEE